MIAAADDGGFFFEEAANAACGFPVELDVVGFALAIDEGVSVDAKSLHVAVVGGDAHVVEEEEEGVEAFGVVGEEVEHAPVFLDVRSVAKEKVNKKKLFP